MRSTIYTQFENVITGNYRVSISVFTTSSWPGVLQAEADRNCIAENEEAESDWEERIEEGNAFDAFNKM